LPGKIGITLKLALGVASSAALFAVWPKAGSDTPSQAERAPATQNAAGTFSPDDGNRFYLPVAGRRYIYKFDRKISFQGEIAGTKLPEVAYSGDFYVDILRSDARAFEALVSQKIKETGGKKSPVVRIEASARGDSVELFSTEGLNEDDKQHVAVLKDLVSLWLFPLRSDTLGSFEARFDTLPSENGVTRERKAKLSYLAGSNLPEILSSLHLLRWDPSLHLPGELRGSETTRMGVSNGTALTADSRYGLEFLSFESIPAYPNSFLSSLNVVQNLLLQASGKPDMSAHPDYAKLDWRTLTAQLRGIDRLDGGQQLELFGDLLKFLRMHPEKIGELTALLRDPALLKAGVQSPLFKTLVGTLATLATPEALTALRDAYDDPSLGDQSRSTILASLTTTQAPIDSATRDFLAQKMQAERDPRLSQAAAFALGSALQQSGTDSQSARAISQIEGAWKAAGNLGDQLALLDVMGNSGRTEFYPSVQTVIESGGNPALRARAVFSLRFMTNSDSQLVLIRSLSDASPVVREAAAKAIELASWKEAFRTPLEVCSGSESVTRVQDVCRKVLSNNAAVASN